LQSLAEETLDGAAHGDIKERNNKVFMKGKVSRRQIADSLEALFVASTSDELVTFHAS